MMKPVRRRLICRSLSVVAAMVFAGGAFAGEAAVATHSASFTLQYISPGKTSMPIDASVLGKLPRTTVQAGAHGAAPTAWEGVKLIDVLRAEGAPTDAALRGNALADVVRVTATDGYQIAFSLGELDAGLGAASVVLVDKHEGKPLEAKDGPYRLVVAADGRPARWIHNVQSIELLELSTRKPPAH
jgi:hypothetical protein